MYTEGEKIEYVYFILSGEFKFSKRIIIPTGVQKDSQCKIKIVNAEMSIIGAGEIFGIEDIIEGDFYRTTCI